MSAKDLIKMGVLGKKQYWQKLRSAFYSSIVAGYSLTEASGTVIKDFGKNGCNGAVINATLANAPGPKGGVAPLFDGTGDSVNIYSAALNSAFNGQEGTVLLWAKARDANVWTDGAARYLLQIRADTSNKLQIYKETTNNKFTVLHSGGGTAISRSITTMSETGWFSVVVTWSKSNNRMRVFLNSAQQDADVTGMGTWTGALAAANNAIGSFDSSGGTCWNGWISTVLILNREATQSEMTPFFNNPPMMVVDYLGGSITNGTSASNYATTSWRALTGAYLSAQNPTKLLNNYNSGVGNTGSWHALFRLTDDILPKNPVMILCDWGVNDHTGDFYRSTEEACIRKILTSAPGSAVYLPLFIVIANPAVDDATDLFATHHAELTTLANYYGLDTIDCIAPIQTAVSGGTHLNTLIDGTVHPLDAGHSIYATAIKAIANTGLNAYPVSRSALPDRMYANSELYENNPPITKLGTEYLSKTGSWSQVLDAMVSSTENDTISYYGTLQSFGIATDAFGGTFAYSIDGGDETEFTTISPYAYIWNGTRGNHTVAFRVVSGSVNISKFMYI